MDMQKMMSDLSKQWRDERSESQMTIGKLIQKLKSMDKNMMIQNVSEPHSYRGYYSDLAFESLTGEKSKVSEFLKMLEDSLGEIFTGYKGGDYLMEEDTPVWVAEYGSCVKKLIGIKDNGSFILEDDN